MGRASRLDGRSPTGEIAERLVRTAETSQISADGQGKLKESGRVSICEHNRIRSKCKQCKQIRMSLWRRVSRRSRFSMK